jgi:hypothetical protein
MTAGFMIYPAQFDAIFYLRHLRSPRGLPLPHIDGILIKKNGFVWMLNAFSLVRGGKRYSLWCRFTFGFALDDEWLLGVSNRRHLEQHLFGDRLFDDSWRRMNCERENFN